MPRKPRRSRRLAEKKHANADLSQILGVSPTDNHTRANLAEAGTLERANAAARRQDRRERRHRRQSRRASRSSSVNASYLTGTPHASQLDWTDEGTDADGEQLSDIPDEEAESACVTDAEERRRNEKVRQSDLDFIVNDESESKWGDETYEPTDISDEEAKNEEAQITLLLNSGLLSKRQTDLAIERLSTIRRTV